MQFSTVVRLYAHTVPYCTSMTRVSTPRCARRRCAGGDDGEAPEVVGLACIVGGDGGASPGRGRRVGGRGEQLECIFARSAWVFAAVFALVFALVFAVAVFALNI